MRWGPGGQDDGRPAASDEVRCRRGLLTLLAVACVAALWANPVMEARAAPAVSFAAAVSAVEQLPYQPAYVATGNDAAFPPATQPGRVAVLNTPPANDYTAGSIVNSSGQSYDPTGVTGAPPWPTTFVRQTLHTADGATLTGWVHTVPGRHPGVLVVHGFNTHGVWSVIRWAALLASAGYDVAAFDQRDFSDDTDVKHPQTFGWKESQDVLTAGRWLAALPGVTSVGVLGFSEGAQNTVLALAQDTTRVFSAGLTFSAPADQDTQIWGTRQPPSCTSHCAYPATDALVSLVVPSPTGLPYTDVCAAIGDAATAYRTTGFSILEQESAMHAQTAIVVPLLNVYAADDSLVSASHAGWMAAYESGNPLQRTLEVAHGEHAYFLDRWWQQRAILTYFKALLPSGSDVGTAATVDRTSGGASFASQEVRIPAQSRAAADAQMGPYVCDPSQGSPGRAAAAAVSGEARHGQSAAPATTTEVQATSAVALPNTAAAPGDGVAVPLGAGAAVGLWAVRSRRVRNRGRYPGHALPRRSEIPRRR